MKYLYIIGTDETPALKIGISEAPEERCRELQIGNPVQLRVMHSRPIEDARATEKAVHLVLGDHRVRGEWFAIGFQAALDAIDAAVMLLDDAKDDPRGNVISWLAPVGQCRSCDRRRAASLEKMKAYRARRKQGGN